MPDGKESQTSHRPRYEDDEPEEGGSTPRDRGGSGAETSGNPSYEEIRQAKESLGKEGDFIDFLREQEAISQRLQQAKDEGERERQGRTSCPPDYTSQAWRNPESVDQTVAGCESQPQGNSLYARCCFGLGCCLGHLYVRFVRPVCRRLGKTH